MVTINGSGSSCSVTFNDRTYYPGDDVVVVCVPGYKPLMRTKGINGYHCILTSIDVKNNNLVCNVFGIDVTMRVAIDKVDYVVGYEEWMDEIDDRENS